MIGWTEGVPKKEKSLVVDTGDWKPKPIRKPLNSKERDITVKRIKSVTPELSYLDLHVFNDRDDFTRNNLYEHHIRGYINEVKNSINSRNIGKKLKERDTYLSCIRNYKKFSLFKRVSSVKHLMFSGAFTKTEEERFREALSIIDEVLDSRNYNEQTKEVIKNCKIRKW